MAMSIMSAGLDFHAEKSTEIASPCGDGRGAKLRRGARRLRFTRVWLRGRWRFFRHEWVVLPTYPHPPGWHQHVGCPPT